MAKERILVVDDEADIRELVQFNLGREGYQVEGAASGEEALEKARGGNFDLMVLDLMLPGINGLEVARQMKIQTGTQMIPIVMLTAKGEEADIVTGLEMGADDYITKPFSPRILVARVRSVLRRGQRTETTEGNLLKVHALEIDLRRRIVSVAGKSLDLTYTEFEVLHVLARHPGWVFTRSQIVDNVRGTDYPVTDRSVDVQIVGLRKKLGAYGKHIETVRGVGYRFREPQ